MLEIMEPYFNASLILFLTVMVIINYLLVTQAGTVDILIQMGLDCMK